MVDAVSKVEAFPRHGGLLKLHRDANFGEVSIKPMDVGMLAETSISASGTGLAIKYLDLGVAAKMPSKTRRGGARNRADRQSYSLRLGQIRNLVAAAGHAERMGLPFTRMITIHWQSAGIPPAGMAKATGRFIDLIVKTLSRHGCKTAWLWVHESGDGKGGHCHLLVHIPAVLVPVLTRLQKGWLRNITGKAYRARVISSSPIGRRLGLEMNNPALHAANLDTALAYLLKGACTAAATAYGLTRIEPGGLIVGKRCGTSQNIGAKARKAWK